MNTLTPNTPKPQTANKTVRHDALPASESTDPTATQASDSVALGEQLNTVLEDQLAFLLSRYLDSDSRSEQVSLQREMEFVMGAELDERMANYKAQMGSIFVRNTEAWQAQQRNSNSGPVSEFEWNFRKHDMAKAKPCTGGNQFHFSQVRQLRHLLPGTERPEDFPGELNVKSRDQQADGSLEDVIHKGRRFFDEAVANGENLQSTLDGVIDRGDEYFRSPRPADPKSLKSKLLSGTSHEGYWLVS